MTVFSKQSVPKNNILLHLWVCNCMTTVIDSLTHQGWGGQPGELLLEASYDWILEVGIFYYLTMCESPTLPDQVLWDTPCMEGVMFNIKFTYLKIIDVTHDSWISKMLQNILKTQQKLKWHLATYRKCNTWFNHNTNAIPITGLYKMLTVTTFVSPVTRKEHVGWSQLKPIGVFEILLLVVQFLYSMLGWAMYSLPLCWSGWLRETFTPPVDPVNCP